MSTVRALVIGVGNPVRGDDGAGIAVVRALRRRHLPGLDIREATGEGAALMDAWKGAENVYLVDAVRAQSEPGTLYRFDARARTLPTRFFHYSTHAFSVAESVELARVLGLLPPRMIVFGIEGAQYIAGAALSPAVADAVEAVTDQIAAEVLDP